MGGSTKIPIGLDMCGLLQQLGCGLIVGSGGWRLLCGLGIFSCCVGRCMFMLCCVVVMNRAMKVIQSNSSS